jgi:uncharacterized protein YndB with AHSA1/START domain
VIEPLRLSFDVDCPREHAFEVWTADTSRWWPPSHTVSGESALVIVFEPHAGGRIYERTAAGLEHDWGEVTVWEPPSRLAYTWHLRVDRADATEVEIAFIERGDATTRVEIEHRGWERLGGDGQQRRDANRAGWGSLLPHFVAAASGTAERSDRTA